MSLQPRQGYRIRLIGPPDMQMAIEVPDRDEVQEQIDFIRWAVLDPEKDALRARIAELESRPPEIREVEVPAPAVEAEMDWPEPGDRLTDWDVVGEPDSEDLTGDDLLVQFEKDEAAAAASIQRLSATRRKHLSEQLNVEKARLRREHMLTDTANPREASIDGLLGLLTRRGEV